MKETLGERYFSGIFWVFLDKAGNGGINFIITIILARLLTPEDFGLVAMVMIFFELSSTFVESGFSAALIRMKSISDVDKSTTFVFNFVAAIVLYLLLFILSPFIAAFFDQEVLIWIIRIMALNLIISSFAIIQKAQLSHKIDFKTQANIRIFSVVISGSAAIIAAFCDLGVWSLVIKFVLASLITSILLCYYNRWIPSFKFDKSSFRNLFGFGSKILITAFINKFFIHIYNVLIGKIFSAGILGFYSQASHFKNLVIFTFYHTIDKVSYAALAKLKEDTVRLREGYRKILKMSSFIIIPALIILGVLAHPFIISLLGSKWQPAVPFLQLLCVSGLTHHFNQINSNVLLILGRPDLNLKLEVVKKIIVVIAIVIGLQYGIYGLIMAEVISAYIALAISAYYSGKFLKYALFHQLKDLSSTVSFSVVSGIIVFFVFERLNILELAHLIGGLVVGSLTYLGLHYVVRTEEMDMLSSTVIPRTISFITRKT